MHAHYQLITKPTLTFETHMTTQKRVDDRSGLELPLARLGERKDKREGHCGDPDPP